jgi:malonate-semialdehyde dehydrogenase (acetylating)/methylmalonate-semialdehyde dehydrogenase
MATPVAVFVGEARGWVDDLVQRARQLRIGPGTDHAADLGPLVSKAARARVERLIQSGVDQGARLLLDGRDPRVDGYPDGNFVGPTIFGDVRTDMDIYTQEIFGPVLLVLGVPDLDAALQLINANPNGNGVGIFTQSGWVAQRFQAEVDVGQVGINLPIPVPVAYFSFTGSRASKLGDLGPNGKQAVEFWTQTKTVMARWFAPSAGAGAVNTTITMK